jgi:hypothetical protein
VLDAGSADSARQQLQVCGRYNNIRAPAAIGGAVTRAGFCPMSYSRELDRLIRIADQGNSNRLTG